jgi:hypothetical protein
MYQPHQTGSAITHGASLAQAPIQFRDTRGRQWTVFERPCKGVPGRKADRCLVFECGEVVRRLWRYPDNWRTLDAEALEKLSWTTGI